MLVGTLAISGVPFFSGFYSKDAILAAAMAGCMADPEHFMLFLLPAVGAVLTAFYMFRMWFLVFAGEPRGFPRPTSPPTVRREHGARPRRTAMPRRNPVDHAHESEPIMAWPLDRPGGPERSSSAGRGSYVIPTFRSATPLLEQMLDYGEPYRAHRPRCSHALLWRWRPRS